MNPAPMPLISALYTGVYALLLVALAVLVSRRRRHMGIGLGAGGDAQLERATMSRHRGPPCASGECAQFRSTSLKYFVPDTVIVAESPVFVSW